MNPTRIVSSPFLHALSRTAALSLLATLCGALPTLATAPDSTTFAESHPLVTELPDLRDDASTSKLVISCDATVASRYLFQGTDLSDGKPVVQPEIVAEYGSVSATVWANHDLDRAETNEFDFLVEYGVEAGVNSFRTGYAHYRYPHRGWEPTQEILAGFTLGLPLSPDLSLHYDFDAGQGAYATLSLSQPLSDIFSVGFEAHHQSGYYGLTGVPSSALHLDGAFNAGSWTLSPSLGYSGAWENEDFRGENKVDSTWIFSLNVAQTF